MQHKAAEDPYLAPAGEAAPDDFDEADLLAAIEEATAAAANAGAAHLAEVERMRVWHWLKDSTLLGATPAADAGLDLAFDTSHLRRKVPDAAAGIVVRLHDGRAVHRTAGDEDALGGTLGNFRVRGIGNDGADVVLRPLDRQRGQVVLAFSSVSLLAPDGTPLDIDTFRRWIERYWWN
jgi:hypothetical protein